MPFEFFNEETNLYDQYKLSLFTLSYTNFAAIHSLIIRHYSYKSSEFNAIFFSTT